jgi:UDPglucose 6-dehydrogenase
MSKPSVAMIGCGKLGLPCAEVMAEHYNVVGYDIFPDPEATIPMMATVEEAVRGRDIIFVAVPTPHDPAYGGDQPIANLGPRDFDYSPVINVFQQINPILNSRQLVVLISTVLPGTVRKHLIPFLTNGRFIYNPYLIAMGSVKWDMVNPECLIIGTEDGSVTGDAQELIEFYQPLMKNEPRVNVGTWDEAEAIKIFYNTFISAKIGLVNMIQDVAEKNGNINVDVVTDALKAATQRITGPRYLTAGLGDAGACHPRDNIALRWLSQDLDLGYDLFHAIMSSRDAQAKAMAAKLVKLAQQHKLPVVIHGKAYKPYVPYTIGSYSLLVGHFVEHAGIELHYADPLTGDTATPEVPAVVLMAHNPAITYAGTGVEVKSDEFYYNIQPGSVIVDPWRTIKEFPGCSVVHYGNPRFSRKTINGRLLNPVNASHVLVEIAERYQFTHNADQPMTYIALAPIQAVNGDPAAQEYINTLKEQLGSNGIKASDQIIFITPCEGMYTHALFWRCRMEKFWPEVDSLQWYYVNELQSPGRARAAANSSESIQLLDIIQIDKWVERHQPIDHRFENKQANFLSYNRVIKSHRCHLVAELIENNLIQNNMISFVPEGELYPGVVETAEATVDRCGYLTPEQKQRYKPLLKNRLVIDDYDVKGNGPQVSNHFEQALISVITETTYEMGDVFFSEKTYRAIAQGHPFIIVGPAYSLEKLRKFGFQTFNGLIDESYDKIEDNNRRMEAIVLELKRINGLDNFSRRALFTAIYPIAEVNKKFFDNHFNLQKPIGSVWQHLDRGIVSVNPTRPLWGQ